MLSNPWFAILHSSGFAVMMFLLTALPAALLTTALLTTALLTTQVTPAVAVERTPEQAENARAIAPFPENIQTLPLNLVLSLSARRVSVYRGDMLIASYAVAVGREGWNTPTGQFSVFQKQVNPAWEHPFTGQVMPPGPDNPLGDRWIGFLVRWNKFYWLSRYAR